MSSCRQKFRFPPNRERGRALLFGSCLSPTRYVHGTHSLKTETRGKHPWIFTFQDWIIQGSKVGVSCKKRCFDLGWYCFFPEYDFCLGNQCLTINSSFSLFFRIALHQILSMAWIGRMDLKWKSNQVECLTDSITGCMKYETAGTGVRGTGI